MKKKSLLLFLSLALISPVFAAEPEQIDLAQKVIKATQFDRKIDQMTAQMQQMAAQALLSSPEMTPAQKDTATKTLGEVAKISADATKDMLQKSAAVFAEVYSEPELKAMLAFFDSPEGKSMLQKQPLVMQRMMPLVQSTQREIMPKIQQIVEKARAESGATPVPANAAPFPLPSPGAGGPMPTPSPSTGPVPRPSPANSTGPMPVPPSGVKPSIQ